MSDVDRVAAVMCVLICVSEFTYMRTFRTCVIVCCNLLCVMLHNISSYLSHSFDLTDMQN